MDKRSDAQGALVHHLGHTCLAIELNSEILLVDPILTHRSLRLRRPAVARWAWPELMDRTRGVVVSHAHGDHLHPPSLLGLDPATKVFGFGTAACEQVAELGFIEVVNLDDRRDVEPLPGLKMTAIPSADSVEGVPQCALLFEVGGRVVLDAVDLRDTNELREPLEPFRERVDIAFLPAGTSIQWQGGWNQMDAEAAVAFASWLAPRKVALAGGAISMEERPTLGSPERYPTSLRSWLAARPGVLDEGCVVVDSTPYSVDLGDPGGPRVCALRSGRFVTGPSRERPQALATTFFSGHDPRFPLTRLAPTNLRAWTEAWGKSREAVRAFRRQLTLLNRRCAAANRTPARALAPRTIARLTLRTDPNAAERILSLLPEGDDLDDLDLSFFTPAEGILRDPPGEDSAEDLLALEVDRALYLLRREELIMRSRSDLTQAQEERMRREHLERLAQEVPVRRPRLRSNHILLGPDSAHLLRAESAQETRGAVLCGASPDGVRYLELDATEQLIMDMLDGRTGSEVAVALSEATGLPEEVTTSAVTALVLRIEAAMPAALGWSP